MKKSFLLIVFFIGLVWSIRAQETLTITGPKTYTNGQVENIFAGVEVSTSGAVTVASGAEVSFQAGSSIHLLPGFSSVMGSRFRAYVPPPPPLFTPGAGTAIPAMPALDSQFESQTVPGALAPGGTATNIVVRMKNAGTATWAAGSVFKLGSQIPSNDAIWGLNRIALGSAVAPGELATFTFSITAPTTPGLYSFKWRMVQEGTAWFGDTTPELKIVVVNNPSGASATVGLTNADAVRLGLDPTIVHATDGSNTQLQLNIHKP